MYYSIKINTVSTATAKSKPLKSINATITTLMNQIKHDIVPY